MEGEREREKEYAGGGGAEGTGFRVGLMMTLLCKLQLVGPVLCHGCECFSLKLFKERGGGCLSVWLVSWCVLCC